jgi:hypothetical protein
MAWRELFLPFALATPFIKEHCGLVDHSANHVVLRFLSGLFCFVQEL